MAKSREIYFRVPTTCPITGEKTFYTLSGVALENCHETERVLVKSFYSNNNYWVPWKNVVPKSTIALDTGLSSAPPRKKYEEIELVK